MTFAAAACSSDPTTPPIDEMPTGTMLLAGGVGPAPGSLWGLLTFRWPSGPPAPISSFGPYSGRLSPDGLTAYSFDREFNSDIFRLIASKSVGAEVSLLQFQTLASGPAGLAVNRTGDRVAFTDGSYLISPGKATVRLYTVERVGWTDVLEHPGSLEGLDWHPDGRRLVTVAYAQVFDQAGRIAIIDIDARTVIPLVPVAERLVGQTVFAPDGRSIVYVRINSDGNAELASIGFDSGRAIDFPAGLIGENPVFSPDGRYVAYCKYVQVGINQRLGRFVRRVSDGMTQQVLPPEAWPDLGCITDWVK